MTETPYTDAAATATLCAARDLIDDGWTQQAYAKNRAGERVSPLSAEACRFCATGALVRASSRVSNDAYAFAAAKRRLADAILNDDASVEKLADHRCAPAEQLRDKAAEDIIVDFNDLADEAGQVLAMFQKAAGACE